MPAPTRRLPRAERERQILDAATRLFGHEPFDEVSMSRVAEAVGVTKPVLYRHFGSKDDLFVACSLRAWERMGMAIYANATSPGPPDVQLWRALVAYFEFIDEHRDVWRVVYPEASRGHEHLGERLREARRAGVAMIAALFAGTGRDGGVDQERLALAEPFALGFTAANTAFALRWLEYPDEPVELQATRVMNLVWTGFERVLAGDVWSPPS